MKLIFTILGIALYMLFGSYLMSVMADEALEIGNTKEGSLFAFLSMVSIPAAILSVGVAILMLFFKVPTEKTANWMKKENI